MNWFELAESSLNNLQQYLESKKKADGVTDQYIRQIYGIIWAEKEKQKMEKSFEMEKRNEH